MEDRYSNDEAGAAYFERMNSVPDYDRPNARDEEDTVCVLTEADILAGRDDDCTLHTHEGDDNPYGYDEPPF
jgi:hypothetical protein